MGFYSFAKLTLWNSTFTNFLIFFIGSPLNPFDIQCKKVLKFLYLNAWSVAAALGWSIALVSSLFWGRRRRRLCFTTLLYKVRVKGLETYINCSVIFFFFVYLIFYHFDMTFFFLKGTKMVRAQRSWPLVFHHHHDVLFTQVVQNLHMKYDYKFYRYLELIFHFNCNK